MVTLEEIQEQTGVGINVIQYWRRRQNEGLLPEPVAVRKKVIYFDGSIVERIRFIREQLEEGVKLPDIKELLLQKDEEALAAYSPRVSDDDGGERLDAVAKLEKMWARGDRKNDVCLALALDPAISGQPSLSVITDVWSFEAPVEVFISIVSNGWVHFARLQINLDGPKDINVADSAKIKASDYGMLLAIIGQKLAENNELMNPDDIPGFVLGGYDLSGGRYVFGPETLEEAKKLTRVLKAGQAFIENL